MNLYLEGAIENIYSNILVFEIRELDQPLSLLPVVLTGTHSLQASALSPLPVPNHASHHHNRSCFSSSLPKCSELRLARNGCQHLTTLPDSSEMDLLPLSTLLVAPAGISAFLGEQVCISHDTCFPEFWSGSQNSGKHVFRLMLKNVLKDGINSQMKRHPG